MTSSEIHPIFQGLKDMSASGLYSDLTIKCEDEWGPDVQEFHVHKLVVHACSPVLRKNLIGPFKEAQENAGILTVHDDLPAFQALIHFMYHAEYSDSFDSENKMQFAVRVYAIADKYEVESLQVLATARLQKVLDPTHTDDFVTALEYIISSTRPSDHTLENIAILVIKKNIKLLLPDRGFRKFLLAVPEMNWELLSMLDDSNNKATTADPITNPSLRLPRASDAMRHLNWPTATSHHPVDLTFSPYTFAQSQ